MVIDDHEGISILYSMWIKNYSVHRRKLNEQKAEVAKHWWVLGATRYTAHTHQSGGRQCALTAWPCDHTLPPSRSFAWFVPCHPQSELQTFSRDFLYLIFVTFCCWVPSNNNSRNFVALIPWLQLNYSLNATEFFKLTSESVAVRELA
jgi:hypothetical protein